MDKKFPMWVSIATVLGGSVFLWAVIVLTIMRGQ